MSKKVIYDPGTRFGRLVVIGYDGAHRKPCGTTQGKHLCRCDCGNIVSVLTQNLRNGNTKSCGCLADDIKNEKRKPNNAAEIHHVWLQYKRHAIDRNLEWPLTDDDVKNIILQPCHYCGEEKTNCVITKHCKEGFYYNGIDRMDNSKGYYLDNVVPCCSKCNRAKGEMSYKEFIELANKIVMHTNLNKQYGDGNEKDNP